MPFTADLDIILPCYNPQPGWDEILVERMAMLRKSLPGKKVRAIVVNDGSAHALAGEAMAQLEEKITDLILVSYPHNMGKGFAIRAGIQRSLAPVIVYTDIDFPYTIESMLHIIQPIIRNEADVTLAIRNATYYDQLPLLRKWMSKMLRFVNRKFLRLHTSDTQGGLKAFNHRVRDVFLQTRINRYLFDLEFVYLISRQNDLRISAIEANLREGIRMSPVRLRIILRESLNFLKVLLK